MTLLEELLSKVEKSDLDQALRVICDEIQKVEDIKIENKDDAPKGPNIFLTIEVPGITTKDICFLCLERETKGKFIVGLWSKQKNRIMTIKRTQAFEVKEIKPEKVLAFFIDKVSLMRGD